MSESHNHGEDLSNIRNRSRVNTQVLNSVRANMRTGGAYQLRALRSWRHPIARARAVLGDVSTFDPDSYVKYLLDQRCTRLRGPESAWHLYLQSLPSTTVPIARLWCDPHAFPDDADACEAARWIHGTEIQRELQDEDGSPLVVSPKVRTRGVPRLIECCRMRSARSISPMFSHYWTRRG